MIVRLKQELDAIRFSGGGIFPGLLGVPTWYSDGIDNGHIRITDKHIFFIDVYQGGDKWGTVENGDWLICGKNGLLFSRTDDEFHAEFTTE